ncbi:hypothetical protein EIP91_009332 [Steccherinum ochraceum]|uniref:Uncharacterized protein n=1 Tax=Steccherinum ochraceum TaxID=92696 RepID=A0A4R0RP52_9APHY|nr:hypothetical protein EIP91_009332 [Steccherinum ochraceum]
MYARLYRLVSVVIEIPRLQLLPPELCARVLTDLGESSPVTRSRSPQSIRYTTECGSSRVDASDGGIEEIFGGGSADRGEEGESTLEDVGVGVGVGSDTNTPNKLRRRSLGTTPLVHRTSGSASTPSPYRVGLHQPAYPLDFHDNYICIIGSPYAGLICIKWETQTHCTSPDYDSTLVAYSLLRWCNRSDA